MRGEEIAMGTEQRSSQCMLGDEFAEFVANPEAQVRGGVVVLAARREKQSGLLEKMAQAEINRLLRAEIADKR